MFLGNFQKFHACWWAGPSHVIIPKVYIHLVWWINGFCNVYYKKILHDFMQSSRFFCNLHCKCTCTSILFPNCHYILFCLQVDLTGHTNDVEGGTIKEWSTVKSRVDFFEKRNGYYKCTHPRGCEYYELEFHYNSEWEDRRYGPESTTVANQL